MAFLTTIPKDAWPYRFVKTHKKGVTAMAVASPAAHDMMEHQKVKFQAWAELTPIEQAVILKYIYGADTHLGYSDTKDILTMAGLTSDESLDLRALWSLAVEGLEGPTFENGFDRQEARLRVARALRVLLFGDDSPPEPGRDAVASAREKADVNIIHAAPPRRRVRSKDIVDITSGVIYTPFEEDSRVGYIAIRAGRKTFVYMNPATESDDGTATVFIYEGEHNDPAMDAAVGHIVVEAFGDSIFRDRR